MSQPRKVAFEEGPPSAPHDSASQQEANDATESRVTSKVKSDQVPLFPKTEGLPPPRSLDESDDRTIPLSPLSPFKLDPPALRKLKTVVCPCCSVEMPYEDFLIHRDRLKKVDLKQRSFSFFQKYFLRPLLSLGMWLMINVFFREVAVVGKENVPKEGPVIFYGNHQNQFMDGMMIMAHCGRPCRFIIAEKSMSRPIVGHFAKLMDAVPVVRPQDVGSAVGKGKLVSVDGNKIMGEGTKFNELNEGDVIIWAVPTKKERCQGQVHCVVSDQELLLTTPVPALDVIREPTSFKTSSRIDHSEMYANVYGTLEKGGAIGIFPEGGSHDRTSMLPLKAGVAIFTLGAAERGIKVQVVPTGLVYFYGHKFRSRAHIEFGKPFHAPAEFVDEFGRKETKREATGKMLELLSEQLRHVTINVSDWSTLKFLHSFRRLYQPHGLLLETKDYLKLTRRLALIIEAAQDNDDFQAYRQKVENYSDLCTALLIRDSQAATLSHLAEKSRSATSKLLFRRIVMLCVLTWVLVPFFVTGLPIALIVTTLTETHARVAKEQSTVKVVGADVQASFKIVLGFVLVPLEWVLVGLVTLWFTDFRTALTVVFSLPVVMYVSLHIMREWVMEFRAGLPLVMSIWAKHRQFVKLFERREALVLRTKEIVQQFDKALDKELASYEDTSDVGKVRQASLFSLRHMSRKNTKKIT